MTPSLQSLVLGTSISFSYILAGNAMTQTFMTVPSLLVGFPPATSPDYISKSALLGRQWGICWTAGNVFFRPISSLATLGYAFTSYYAYNYQGKGEGGFSGSEWRVFAIATVLHGVVIVHSAVNMQPLNDRIARLEGVGKEKEKVEGKGKGKGKGKGMGAEELLRWWGTLNLVRVVCPLIAGTLALSRLLG